MNSINAEQPEDNHENLVGEAAIEKIRELAKQAHTCFFCTAIQTGRRIETRPMAIQDVDASGRIRFLSASDSHLNAQIGADARVQLMMQGSSHSDLMTIYGEAQISRDRAAIDELWKPIYKTWFTEGKDDPRITLVSVAPLDGYYWDTKHNRVVVMAKMLVGAVTGKTLDDSIEGTLRV